MSKKTILANKLKKNGDKIVKLLNDLEILEPPYKFYFGIETVKDAANDGVYTKFLITDTEPNTQNASEFGYRSSSNTYAAAYYSIEKDTKNKGNITGVEKGIYSNLGNKTGTFLFYLQLLLIIKTNIVEFRLDNFTDDPVRAAKGIYSPLRINIRKNVTGYNRHEYAGKTKEERLQMAEGQMRYILTGDSYKELVNLIEKINTKIKPTKPWNKDIHTQKKLQKFITNIQAHMFVSGKKKSKKKKTKKNETKTKRKKRNN